MLNPFHNLCHVSTHIHAHTRVLRVHATIPDRACLSIPGRRQEAGVRSSDKFVEQSSALPENFPDTCIISTVAKCEVIR